MGNALSPEPAKADPAAPAPNLAQDLASERAAREATERFNRELIASIQSGRPLPEEPPKPAGPHPLERVAKEGFDKLDPVEQARTIDLAGRRSAAEALGPAIVGVKEELQREFADGMNRMLFENVMTSNPDIAKDQEGFSAAMSRAQFRASQVGKVLPTAEFLRESVRIYRESKPAPAVFVEGASPGEPGAGGPAAPPVRKPGLSNFEKVYGKVPPSVELKEEDYDHEARTTEYVDKRIDFLEKRGLDVEDSSTARQVLEQHEERKARKAAAGGE